VQPAIDSGSDPTISASRENRGRVVALTVDVEGDLRTVEAETNRILDRLSELDLRATFFVVGEIARRHPALIRSIAAGSHEIGFHGARHVSLLDLAPAGFSGELAEWIPRLEDIAQSTVRGFRAPYHSLTEQTAWALPILAASTLDYDASLYAGLHRHNTWRGAPARPALLAGTRLKLYPLPLLHPALPIGFSGGRWLRVLPWPLVLWGMRRHLADDRPGMVYLHSWEPAGSPRVDRLLRRFRDHLRPMGEILASLPRLPEWRPD
jgi:peptidoglycan/xylan/chitin deacetylase (PgdA/CDA1 family)